MSIPLDHRVADVRVLLPDGRERRGTGFLVSPGRILTALHVISREVALHQPTLGPVAATIEVRLIGDLVREGGSAHVDPKRAAAEMAERSRKSWRSVKLIWPEVGDPIPRFEVALLEFTEFSSTGPLAFVVPPLVGTAKDGTPIRALGFRGGASSTPARSANCWSHTSFTSPPSRLLNFTAPSQRRKCCRARPSTTNSPVRAGKAFPDRSRSTTKAGSSASYRPSVLRATTSSN